MLIFAEVTQDHPFTRNSAPLTVRGTGVETSLAVTIFEIISVLIGAFVMFVGDIRNGVLTTALTISDHALTIPYAFVARIR